MRRPAHIRTLGLPMLVSVACAALLAGGCVTGRSPSERPDARVAPRDVASADAPQSSFEGGSWLTDRGVVQPDTPSFDAGGGGDAGDGGDGGGGGDAGDGGNRDGGNRDGASPVNDGGACDAGLGRCDGGGGPTGQWYQANRQVCTTFCATLGKTNVASPEGARCMSGEVRPASGIAAGITFTYGCWRGCAATSSSTAASAGAFCYRSSQKRDADSSDLTVGCYCQ